MNSVFGNMLRAAVNDKVRRDAEKRGQLTLGMLQTELERVGSDLPVIFDIGGSPCNPHSYRGHYDQVAFENCENPQTALDVIVLIEQTIGETFTGWKGGEFRMNRYTMVWVSDRGSSSGQAIVGVHKEADKIVISTKNIYES